MLSEHDVQVHAIKPTRETAQFTTHLANALSDLHHARRRGHQLVDCSHASFRLFNFVGGFLAFSVIDKRGCVRQLQIGHMLLKISYKTYWDDIHADKPDPFVSVFSDQLADDLRPHVLNVICRGACGNADHVFDKIMLSDAAGVILILAFGLFLGRRRINSFVGSVEPFRDETASYVERLRQAGVPADFKIFDGCFHAFDMICGKSRIAKEAVAFLMESYNHALEHYFAAQPAAYTGRAYATRELRSAD
jgi:hypothetical protein